MKFKQNAKSLPKLSKGKLHSLDMHEETIRVILLRQVFSECAGENKKGLSGKQYIDNINHCTKASLEENIRVADDMTAWCKRSVQLERLK